MPDPIRVVDIHAVPAPLLRVTPTGAILDLNEPAAVLLQCRPPALIGSNLLDHVDHVAAPPGALAHALADALAAPAGASPAVAIDLVPVPGAPRVPATATVGRDGGDVLVALASREAAARAEAILDALADSTLLLDEQGLVSWQSNRLAQRLSDLAEGTAVDPEGAGLGANPLERIHPEDLPGVLDSWALAVTDEGSLLRYTVRSRGVEQDDLWQRIEVSGVSQLQNPYLRAMIVQVRNLDDGVVVESLGETDDSLQSLADAAPIGIVMTDPYDRTVYRNRAARDLLEQPELRPDSDWRELVRDPFRDDLDAVLAAARDEGTVGTTVVAVDLPSGTSRWLRVHVTPSYRADRQSIGLITTLEDVTAETEARAESTRLTQMLDATSDYVAIFRPNGEILYVNRATTRLLDALRAEGSDGMLRDLIDDEPRRVWIDAALAVLEHSNVWSGELLLNAGGGATIPVSALGVIHRGPDGQLDWIAMLGRDISELKVAEARLRELATHDHLTGLANRPLFNERLERAVARQAREHWGLAVMFCDLDGFKEINDEHGHARGDEVLVVLADRLRHITRDVDTAARVGGDEFVVLCEGVSDPDELAALAERVIDAVSAPIVLSSGASVAVGISVGIGRVDAAGEKPDPDALLTLADTMMYRAKARGGNCFRIATL